MPGNRVENFDNQVEIALRRRGPAHNAWADLAPVFGILSNGSARLFYITNRKADFSDPDVFEGIILASTDYTDAQSSVFVDARNQISQKNEHAPPDSVRWCPAAGFVIDRAGSLFPMA